MDYAALTFGFVKKAQALTEEVSIADASAPPSHIAEIASRLTPEQLWELDQELWRKGRGYGPIEWGPQGEVYRAGRRARELDPWGRFQREIVNNDLLDEWAKRGYISFEPPASH